MAATQEFQVVGQGEPIERTWHVWKRRKDRKWKCCLCGGVTNSPDNDGMPLYFEQLTEEERALCPNHNAPRNR